MAFIDYLPEDAIPANDRVDDRDNIMRIHSVHTRVMRQHHDFYVEIMRGPGPLSRVQREMLAVVVSAANRCFY